MDAVQVLKDYKAKAEGKLASFFDEKIKEAGHFGVYPEELLKDLKEYTLRGGKRIRSTMAIYGFNCFQEENEAILEAAVSLELMHAFLLIHDDIMDEDLLRRGGKTFHIIYKEKAEQRFPKIRAQRFGENIGIIGGDLLQSFGFEALMKADFDMAVKEKAINKLNEIVHFTSFGQLLDLMNEVKENVSEKDVLLVHELKTARYTIEGPLQLGAILAGASQEGLKALSAYGIPLGQAFQLQDDVLGLFGSEKKVGKPVDSDLKEGKKTLLVLQALEKADAGQKQKLLSALGNQNLTAEEAEEVRQIVKDSGALDYSKQLAEKLIGEAKQAIEKTSFKPEAKEFLLSVADYMLSREI